MLDATGVSVSKWSIKKCVIVNADFGNGEYGNDGLNLITVTIQPEDCVLITIPNDNYVIVDKN